MTDLLNIKEAAFKLGMTSSELKKLVREGLVPFVNLPNGIRFDTDDLTNWVQSKKGGDMTTATITEREQLQEHVRKVPEYKAEIGRLEGDRAAIQAHIDTGKATDMALVPIDRKLDHFRKLLNNAQNKFSNQLFNTCENDDLRDEWFDANEQRKGVSRELRSEQRLLEETERTIKNLRDSLEQMQADTGGCKPSERSELGDRLRKLQRDITSQERFQKRYQERIEELTTRRDELEAKKANIREAMIFD